MPASAGADKLALLTLVDPGTFPGRFRRKEIGCFGMCDQSAIQNFLNFRKENKERKTTWFVTQDPSKRNI